MPNVGPACQLVASQTIDTGLQILIFNASCTPFTSSKQCLALSPIAGKPRLPKQLALLKQAGCSVGATCGIVRNQSSEDQPQTTHAVPNVGPACQLVASQTIDTGLQILIFNASCTPFTSSKQCLALSPIAGKPRLPKQLGLLKQAGCSVGATCGIVRNQSSEDQPQTTHAVPNVGPACQLVASQTIDTGLQILIFNASCTPFTSSKRCLALSPIAGKPRLPKQLGLLKQAGCSVGATCGIVRNQSSEDQPQTTHAVPNVGPACQLVASQTIDTGLQILIFNASCTLLQAS